MGYSKSGEPGADLARWDDFRALIAIANATSIKRAARELGTTQSALSKRLVRLETTLGARLVERGPLGATLTYQGERVFARVLAAQKELSRATTAAQAAESRVEGDCSILAADGIANFWIAKFLPAYFDLYPDIELRMMLDHALDTSRNQTFDIRIHYYEPIDPAQIMKPLATVHFIPFASPGYLRAHGTPRTVADLSRHRVLDQTHHLVDRGAWAAWFDDELLKRTAMFTNQSAFLGNCVREGVGIAFMPTYMVLTEDNIVPLDIGAAIRSNLYVSYHRERAIKAPVKTTLAYLRSAVFDAKTMPWFGEELRLPDESWRALYRDTLARAGTGAPVSP